MNEVSDEIIQYYGTFVLNYMMKLVNKVKPNQKLFLLADLGSNSRIGIRRAGCRLRTKVSPFKLK